MVFMELVNNSFILFLNMPDQDPSVLFQTREKSVLFVLK